MPASSTPAPQRRRGRALERSLLEATWAELTEHGYDAFTIDAAAGRANTSRTVFYRRWAGKNELVHAAIGYAIGQNTVTAPDTGSLRGDVIALLRQTNQSRVLLATQLFTQLGGFFRVTGTSLADLAIDPGDRHSLMDRVIQRAIERGEIQPGQVSERIAQLPADLFRYEVLMTLQPIRDTAIEEIVDTIFLPLVNLGNRRGQGDCIGGCQ
jgi:AcrR family transcriptional regulator